MSEVSKYITIIRPEFMTFCDDACRAATLNHLLFRIAYKCKDQPKEKIQAGEVLWYAKTELLTWEMSNAWGVCKVRNEVNGLVEMNLIGRTKDPVWGANRTKHFYFGAEQCAMFIQLCEKNHICIVHLDLPVEVKHLIYLSNANDKSIKCSCPEGENGGANDKSIKCKSYIYQMQTIDPSDANDKSIGAITKDYLLKINNKDKGTLFVDDAAASQPQTPFFDPQKGETAGLPIATGSTGNVTPFPVLPTTPLPPALRGSRPSLPGIDPSKPAKRISMRCKITLIPPAENADASSRNDYRKDSHAQGAGATEADNPQGSEGDPPKKSARTKGNQPPRSPKPKVSEKEVEEYLTLFDRLGRETDAFPNGYGHTGVDHDHVRKLLKNNLREETPKFVTPQKLDRLYRFTAALPEDDKGYRWFDKGMSIKSICNNYTYLEGLYIADARKKREEKQRREQPAMTTEEVIQKAQADIASGQQIGPYQFRPQTEKAPVLNYVHPRQLKQAVQG